MSTPRKEDPETEIKSAKEIGVSTVPIHDGCQNDDPVKIQNAQSVVRQGRNAGLGKLEALNHGLDHSDRSGTVLRITLIVSLGLTMLAYALSQGITSQFDAMATLSFNRHAGIGAANTASQIINAVSKPFIGKMADITSRPTAYTVVLPFYAVGFGVAAGCTNLAAYIVGIALTAFGKLGLDLLSEIIVGDLATIQGVDSGLRCSSVRSWSSSLLTVSFPMH